MYQQTYRCYPPAYVADEDGKPMHSWRVLLLPLFGDPELTSLYEQYDFDEPWDGPNNRRLAAQAPDIFRCPSDEGAAGQTNYVAVVGEETIWPGARPVSYHEMLAGDGHLGTIAVVEATGLNINWLEPRDLPFEEAAPSSKHSSRINAAFCDGRVLPLPPDMKPETLRALLTRNGGENVKFPE
jgi:prepilin-type processing-associated H-X9-DG protein